MIKDRSSIINLSQNYERNITTLLNRSKENILIVSPKTKRILFASKSACKYLGYKKNEIRDISLCNIVSEEYPAISLNEPNQESLISIELRQFITKAGDSFLAEKKSEVFNFQNADTQIISFQKISEIINPSEDKPNTDNKLIPIYEAINKINQKIDGVNQDMFLKNMTYSLSDLLKVKWAMICKISQPACKKAEIMMIWDQKQFQKNIVYSIKGTPCGKAFKSKEPYFCGKELIDLFPADRIGKDMGVNSYLGVPILSVKKEVIGILAVMHNKSMNSVDKLRAKAILQYMALRCSYEIKKYQYNDQNKQRKNIKKYLKVLPDQKPLSIREEEVVGCVIKGFADSNIAQKLSISIPTVKFHLKNIYKKLGINNRKGFLKIYCID
jgi:DNA-binding CsgD family transcriptional regulator